MKAADGGERALATVSELNALEGTWENPSTRAHMIVRVYTSARGRRYPRESVQVSYVSSAVTHPFLPVPVRTLKLLIANDGWRKVGNAQG